MEAEPGLQPQLYGALPTWFLSWYRKGTLGRGPQETDPWETGLGAEGKTLVLETNGAFHSGESLRQPTSWVCERDDGGKNSTNVNGSLHLGADGKSPPILGSSS